MSLEAETNRYSMLELGQIVTPCITPCSVKTPYKTSCVHVAKLKMSSSFFSFVRQIMIEKVKRHCVPTLNVLLYGDLSLNNHTNSIIFKDVQEFIAHSK